MLRAGEPKLIVRHAHAGGNDPVNFRQRRERSEHLVSEFGVVHNDVRFGRLSDGDALDFRFIEVGVAEVMNDIKAGGAAKNVVREITESFSSTYLDRLGTRES